MNREVIGLMQEGYVSPEMLDRAVKASLMPRGLLLGVVQRMDFNGLDMVARGLRNRSFEPFGAPPEDNVIAEMAERGELINDPNWHDWKFFQGNIATADVDLVMKETDNWIASLGYKRDGLYYRCERENDEEYTVALFAHGGSCPVRG